MLGAARLWAGCAKNRGAALREQAQAYTQLLMDERYDRAVDYYDPV